MWVKANDTIYTIQQAAQYIGGSQSGSVPLEVIPLEASSLELEVTLLDIILLEYILSDHILLEVVP